MGSASSVPNIDGFVFTPKDRRYDDLRQIFNGLIDRRPDAIVLPRSVDSACAAIEHAIETGTPFSVRGGGHNVAGSAVLDAGIVVDCRLLRSVAPIAGTSLIKCEPGATWREYDLVSSALGRATPGGIISDTGVAGLSLGGGIGWLNGLHGLSCDNLVEASVLLADGQRVRAAEDENADLFWALRGGGGNFGFVYDFTFASHPIANVYAGSILYSEVTAIDALKAFWEAGRTAPDELTLSLVATVFGDQRAVSIDVCYAGDSAVGEAITKPLVPTNSRSPVRDTRIMRTYLAWQKAFDDPRRYGRRSYWKSLYIDELTSEFIDAFQEMLRTAPSPHTMLTFDHLHGATQRVDIHSTAFAHRDKMFLFLINSNWDTADEDEANIAWTKKWFDVLLQTVPSTSYLNYLSDEGSERIVSAYGALTFAKLRSLKSKFDPSNLFRSNQNILPKE